MNPKERPLDEDSTPTRGGRRRREQQDLDRAMTALVEGGLIDNRAIAGQLGISPQSVRRHRRQLGIANRPRTARFTIGSREEGDRDLAAAIRRLLREGLSKRETARRLSVSEKTVYQHLKADRSRVGAKEHAPRYDDGYPEEFLREVPPDYTLILPRGHLTALLRAAARCNTPAARESLRQALLLHES